MYENKNYFIKYLQSRQVSIKIIMKVETTITSKNDIQFEKILHNSK